MPVSAMSIARYHPIFYLHFMFCLIVFVVDSLPPVCCLVYIFFYMLKWWTVYLLRLFFGFLQNVRFQQTSQHIRAISRRSLTLFSFKYAELMWFKVFAAWKSNNFWYLVSNMGIFSLLCLLSPLNLSFFGRKKRTPSSKLRNIVR